MQKDIHSNCDLTLAIDLILEIKCLIFKKGLYQRKLFKCNIREKTFIQTSYFIRHYRVHTGDNPLKCDICEKTFNQSAYLIRHKRAHTGENPFKCDICETGIYQRKPFIKENHLSKKTIDSYISLTASFIV